jgi:hypothetical protein
MFRQHKSRALGYTCLLLGGVLMPACAETVSFADNFSPPSSLWSNSTGNWTATGGDYYAQVPNNNPYAETTLPFDLTSYTLTLTVNALGDSGIFVRTNTADTQWVLLVLGGNGYGAGFRGGNAGSSLYWADSSNSSEQGLVTGAFTPGNVYTITVKAVDDTFSAYINGSSTPISVFTDAVAGLDGEVGLYDNQPKRGGFGPPTTYSTFSLQGTTVSSVPEPGTVLLLAAGLAGLAIARHRKCGAPKLEGA